MYNSERPYDVSSGRLSRWRFITPVERANHTFTEGGTWNPHNCDKPNCYDGC